MDSDHIPVIVQAAQLGESKSKKTKNQNKYRYTIRTRNEERNSENSHETE
jgi:hypothetical protein